MFNTGSFDNVESLTQFTHNTPVFLVYEYYVTGLMLLCTCSHISFAWGIICWVVMLSALPSGWMCTLKERRALCEDGLKSVNVLLSDFIGSVTDTGELNASEGSTLWAQVPSRYQIAMRGLMIDLSCSR